MNHIKLIPTFQRKKSIPKQLKDLQLTPLNEQFSKLTTPILSDDYMRPVMMGNFFDMENRKIVSTDAHKLTAINMPNETFDFIKQTYKKELNENPKGLIFHTLSQLKSDYNELVKVATENNNPNDFQPFDEYVKFREIEDGRYPDYEAIIPRDFTNVVNVDYQKLYWYSKVLLDAKVIDDVSKLNSSNNNEYQNKKIDDLKDSYVSFLDPITDTESKKIIEKDIILTYTLDGEKQYIIFNAIFLCQILKFAMEFNGKYFGKIGISGNFRGILIEFENEFLLSNSFGILMPVRLRNDDNTIGDEDYNNNVKMYYDLDTNEINSDGVNYPIDETIGFKANKESLSIPKIRVEEKVTTEVTSDNSYIDDINIDNKILIVEEKGKPLSTYKNGDKVFWANVSFDKNWKQYVEGEVFIKDDEYSIKRFPQNPNFKKYPLSTFNSNTKVVLKPNNEPIYFDKTIKNNGVKNTQNDSITFITNRIKGLKIALKVARAENKPKIQKRILGLEIAKKMQNPKYSVAKKVEQIEKTNNTNTYEDLLEQDRDLQSQIDEEKRKPKNEQSELKRLALEREVILRKIDEMEQFKRGGGVDGIDWYKYDGQYEAEFGNFYLYVIPSNERGRYYVRVTDGYRGDIISESREEILGLDNAKEFAIDIVGDYMKQFNKGGVVFTNYNGSEIMYEPNYDEYFVNDEVFDSMEDAKNYIDTGEIENEKYSFGGGLLVGSLVGGYLGYKVGKYNKQVVSSGFQTEKLIGKDIKNKLQGKKTYGGGGSIEEIKTKYQIAGNDSSGVYTYSKRVADEIASKYGGDVQEDGSKWYVKLEDEDEYKRGGGVEDNLLKELHKLQRDLNSSRLNTYIQDDNSEEEMARRRERESKLVRFNEVLSLLNEIDSKKFDEGGGVDTISDEDLLRIKLAVAEAQDRIKANDKESESGGSASDITNFIKENPQLLMLLEKGGSVGDENYEMLKNKVTELLHHSKELQAVVKKKPKTPAWVISKSSRASTDLSDITHYLEGKL